MTRYHINKHGVPAPCKAKKGNCPLGGSEAHFDSIEAAQEYTDKEMEGVYGLTNLLNIHEEEYDMSRKYIAEGLKPNALDSEAQINQKDLMREEFKKLELMEKKYGVSTNEILSRRRNDIWPDISKKEVKRWKNIHGRIEKFHEDIGLRYKQNQYISEKNVGLDNKRSREYIDKLKSELKEVGSNEIDIAKEIKKHEDKIAERNKAIEDIKERAVRYEEYYSKEAIRDREIDALYLSEEDTIDLHKRKGFIYKIASGPEADAIMTQIDEMDKSIQTIAKSSGFKGDPKAFWKDNYAHKKAIGTYRNLFWMRNATREDLEKVSEDAKEVVNSAREYFKLNKVEMDASI